MFVCTFICIFVCTFVYMYLYIYTPFTYSHPNHCKGNISFCLAPGVCTIAENNAQKLKNLENFFKNHYPDSLSFHSISLIQSRCQPPNLNKTFKLKQNMDKFYRVHLTVVIKDVNAATIF